jgi:DNA-binding phage protein
MSQRELSEQTGIHCNTVKASEGHDANPRLQTILTLVHAMGGRLQVVFSKTEDQEEVTLNNP